MKGLAGILLAIYIVQSGGISALSQDPSPGGEKRDAELTTTALTEKEVTSKWQEFASDKGWQALMKEVEGKGFKRIDQSSSGFRGTIKNPADGKSMEVLFYAYDFYSPAATRDKSFQTASMIFGNIGGRIYKAYLVFPRGVKDIKTALAESQEWFADDNGKVQKAHSFGSRLGRCIEGGKHVVYIEGPNGIKMRVTANCKTSCLAAIAVCGGAAAILEVASGGLGTVPLIGVFFLCAGGGCASCLVMCALASL
jgi:hypothetical protein